VFKEAVDGYSWPYISHTADIFVLMLSIAVSVVMFTLVPVLIRFVNCWSDIREEV
jgi:hypothetical protein